MGNVEKVLVRSTSKGSAVCTDIVLRQSSTTQLVFRPEIVENLKNPEAPVRGTFIYQRKKPSGEFVDCESLPLSKLKSGDWVKIELHSDELLTLMQGLGKIKIIADDNEIAYGTQEYVLTSSNIASIAGQLANLTNAENVIDSLKDLNPDVLQNLDVVLGVSRLQNALRVWADNKENSKEEFWHQLFRDNSWLLAQLLLHPVIIFEDKAYVGGKRLDNTGGKVPDFLLQNNLTTNVLVLEIKTPVTRLLGNDYRQTYSVSAELSGTINQALSYKQHLLNYFHPLARETDKVFETFDPKCVIIAGNTDEIDSKEKKGAFELFRNQLKNVEIVTYDELFEKAKAMTELFSKQVLTDEQSELSVADDDWL
jgi:hypothetical protein